MAETKGYPQIPGRVWWGLRKVLLKSPRIKLDDHTLAAELGVQQAAARQYLSELKRVGLLTEDGAATELAMKWRMDETYRETADEILAANYPDGLVQIAPAGGADREKVIRWFMGQGLGGGTAKNKAGTYLMIANDEIPGPDGVRQASVRKRSADSPSSTSALPDRGKPKSKGASSKEGALHEKPRADAFPLNVNVQIHISAEASSDQIESIFKAMRKHLYDGELL